MRDMIFGAVILGWTFLAAQAGTGPLSTLFGTVHATLAQVLAQLG